METRVSWAVRRMFEDFVSMRSAEIGKSFARCVMFSLYNEIVCSINFRISAASFAGFLTALKY